jgi:hypothetical protein
LKKTLEVALGSLNMLNGMYEIRESRWQQEMTRMQEDKEKMSLVLNQVLGNFQVAQHSAPGKSESSESNAAAVSGGAPPKTL